MRGVPILIDPVRLEVLRRETEARADDGDGDFIECGVAFGGSAAEIAEILHRHFSKGVLHLLDSWDGFPRPSTVDVNLLNRRTMESLPRPGAKRIFGQIMWDKSSARSVAATLQARGLLYRCKLWPGWFAATLPKIPGPFSFAHVDGDLYSSTYDCLSYLLPRMTERGVLVIDDYGNDQRRAWPGVKAAVDACIAGTDWRVTPGDGRYDHNVVLRRA